MRIRKLLSKIVGISVIAAGLGLFLYPDAKSFLLRQQAGQTIEDFEKTYGVKEEQESGSGRADLSGSAWDFPGSAGLKEKAEWYNASIYENGQADFKDAWSVAQSPVELTGLPDSLFGYVEIPAMEVKLPLYVGASASHMAKGAAILGATSLPIGGENTNSVIAGHRGYRGAPYFREIEKLKPGDTVSITNPWEVLHYRVESVDVILPDDSDAVKIREEKDMVTLLTCHPYRSNGKYRYVVYCVRAEGDQLWDEPGSGQKGQDPGWIISGDGSLFESSEPDIRMEQLLRRCGILLILVMIGITAWKKLFRKKHYDEF